MSQTPTKGPERFFSYDPAGDMEFHHTAEQAKETASQTLDVHENDASDSDWIWHYNPEDICWGEIHGRVSVTDRPLTDEEALENPDWQFIRDVSLDDIHHETKQTPRQILESREALRAALSQSDAFLASLMLSLQAGIVISRAMILAGMERTRGINAKALTLAKEGGQA